MLTRTVTPISGTSYTDIRWGEGHNIHQTLLDATALAASRDADGNIPPGLPVSAAGGIVAAGDAAAIVGPEPVKLGSTNVFGNAIFSSGLNRDMIESNLGRVLSAAELAGIASGLPGVVLR